MLNTLLALLTFVTLAGEKNHTPAADVTESTVVWKASKVTGKHEGTVTLTESSLVLKGTELKGGSFTADMTSINTTDLEGEYKDKLDGHLKSDDFFGVEKYPTSTFKITKVKKTGSNSYDVTGNITIKGKTETVNFPAQLAVAGDKITATAVITLDRTKFGIRYGSGSFFDNLGDKAIDDKFTLEVTLVSTK
ncbi:lipid-binding protein [Reichenbachiella sp. 5M10]|uniref:YceI family protein n=1 Tax=Reichenbachiella sp. 5M10 TaxID=1889772 RepID=UPI000C146A8D|nr:YceI family protein [Reichenbachiella sp. 5M10]PIB36839.1 lipid-binding protein [Reichenbachiella sp. 5M10]